MTPWKTLSRKQVWQAGNFLAVEMHAVELPDGRVIPDWSWIVTPDYVTVVAVDMEGKFLCFRQTKYAVEGLSLATVGGYMEPGENPLDAAKRELLEETGYEAAKWTFMGQYAVDANRGNGKAHFFLATEARPTAAMLADDLEEQDLLLLSREEVTKALLQGEFKALSWAAIIAVALAHLK